METSVCNEGIELEPIVIIWKNNKILKWSDFEKKSDSNSNASANSAIGFESKPIIEYTKRGNQLEYKIKDLQLKAIFIPNLSWVVKNISKKDSILLLKHEQGHFDLAEEIIRKTKKDITITGNTFTIKGRNNDGVKELTSRVDEIRKKIELELQRKFHNQELEYDNKTNHGLIPKHQIKYNKRFKKLRE